MLLQLLPEYVDPITGLGHDYVMCEISSASGVQSSMPANLLIRKVFAFTKQVHALSRRKPTGYTRLYDPRVIIQTRYNGSWIAGLPSDQLCNLQLPRSDDDVV